MAYLPMVELVERQMLDSYTTVLGASDHGRPEKVHSSPHLLFCLPLPCVKALLGIHINSGFFQILLIMYNVRSCYLWSMLLIDWYCL